MKRASGRLVTWGTPSLVWDYFKWDGAGIYVLRKIIYVNTYYALLPYCK